VVRRAPVLPAHLEPLRLDGEPVAERSFEDVELAGVDLAAAGLAHDLELLRARLRDVSLTGASARGLSMRHVTVDGGGWANADLQHAALRAVELREVRATGADLGEARLTDVLFEDCRLDLSLFRFAKLERVVFAGCKLDEADFYGAELNSVLFERCSLVGASFDAARLSRCQIEGGDLSGLVGVGSLAGVRMAWPEVVQIAGLLAEANGIHVLDG
jgi:uncharacterized protein YjbI with pentapeptide repeats